VAELQSHALGLSMRISVVLSTRLPHDKLLLTVQSKVIDRSVVKLISMWLKGWCDGGHECPGR